MDCFNPLWINTALKPSHLALIFLLCFNPLWINTALKRCCVQKHNDESFNPLWINTALKRISSHLIYFGVSIPYGLTLLSNKSNYGNVQNVVSIPYGLTLLSNLLSRFLL